MKIKSDAQRTDNQSQDRAGSPRVTADTLYGVQTMIFNPRNIQRALTLVILLLVSTGCTHNKVELSANYDEAIKSEVNQSFLGLVEAAKSLNVERYLQFFDKDNFTSLNENGSVFHSLTDFENPYREQISYLEKYKSLEFFNVKITVINKSTAILVNEFHAVVLLKSGETVSASGAGTQVWSKMSDKWKLVNVSSSSK